MFPFPPTLWEYEILSLNWMSKRKDKSYLPHMTRLAPKLEMIWENMLDKSWYGNGILDTLKSALNFT